MVSAHLEQQGFVIVARNARVGRLEIDVIARRDDLFVFCEVRSRTSAAIVDPIDTINRAKQRRIRQAAEIWLLRRGSDRMQVRFDAASILWVGEGAELSYYEEAF